MHNSLYGGAVLKVNVFVMVGVLLLSLTLLILFNITYAIHANNANLVPLPVIVIDAGHGGVDGGASAYDGTIEKDINLKIANKLIAKFKMMGFKVIATRETDISIHDDDANSIRNKKRSDIRNRLKLVEDNNATLISIHQNNFSQSKYRGTQVFYGKENSESKGIAGSIQNSIKNLIQPNNSREIKKSTSDIFLLNNCKTPAVLVECGFLSNADETELLKTSEYQEKICFGILCGYLNYYTNSILK